MNPAQPAPGTPLCDAADIPEAGAKTFRYRVGEAIFQGFVARKDGALLGYVDRCPHTGLPLEMFGRYFTSEGDYLICSSHGALFQPKSGLCVAGPCAGRSLWPWPIEVKDGVILAA